MPNIFSHRELLKKIVSIVMIVSLFVQMIPVLALAEDVATEAPAVVETTTEAPTQVAEQAPATEQTPILSDKPSETPAETPAVDTGSEPVVIDPVVVTSQPVEATTTAPVATSTEIVGQDNQPTSSSSAEVLIDPKVSSSTDKEPAVLSPVPTSSWFGYYYDYSAGEAGMNLPVDLWPDTIPFGPQSSEWATYKYNYWFADSHLVSSGYTNDLQYDSSYFPLDSRGADDPSGKSQHNFHFGAHFVSVATVAQEGDYEYYLFSDDDSFLYVNNVLKENRSGINPPSGWSRTGKIHMVPGQSYRLDIYYTERFIDDSALIFRFNTPGVVIKPCTNGSCPANYDYSGHKWYSWVFDYDKSHKDMNLPGSSFPDRTTTGPLNPGWDRDWYDQKYFVRNQYFGELDYPIDFFPVDDLGPDSPVAGDVHNFHFGIHFLGVATTSVEGDYTYTLLSDDDSYLYVDNVLLDNNSGLNPNRPVHTGTIHMKPGYYYRIDIFSTERHHNQSAMQFKFVDPGVNIEACDDGVCPINPVDNPIKVKSPNGGEKWPLKTNQNITWTATSSIPSVKIDLVSYRDCTGISCQAVLEKVYNLTASTSNSGIWSWDIGQSWATTTPYKIRITGIYGTSTVTDDSDEPFYLTNAATDTPPIGQKDINPATIPDGKRGDNYCQTLSTAGFTGSSTIAWSIISGSLPAGLALAANSTNGQAEICGTPVTTGSYAFTVLASSTDGQSATRAYNLTIKEVSVSGGGGGGYYVGSVLGTSTVATSSACSIYLKKFIKYGENNDQNEVKKLQAFLVAYQHEDLKINGRYDLATYEAVKRFQQKYVTGVLKPWGMTEPSGYVYITTTAKINRLFCEIYTDPNIDLRYLLDEEGIEMENYGVVAAPATNLALGSTSASSSSSTYSFFASLGALGFVKGLGIWLFWILVALLVVYFAWRLLFRKNTEETVAVTESADDKSKKTDSASVIPPQTPPQAPQA